MDNQFKTSFIPKKPIETSADLSVGSVSRRRVGRTIFSLVGTLIFIASLGAYGGTFAWEMKLKSDISRQVESLQRAKNEFDENFTQEASRLNTRIEEAQKILDNHVSPSSLYSLLQEYTLQTVAFDRFTFEDNSDGTISVKGTGDAERFESIVLQSDWFGKSGYLRNVIFTDTRQNLQTQSISFSFEATLDPRLVLYRQKLERQGQN